jgi:hypothetical protein
MSRPTALALLLPLLLVCGCGRREAALPPLHPVHGRVVKDGKPVAGGLIQLVPEHEQAVLVINGNVGADGRFTLTTLRNKDRAEGAPDGVYLVIYHPPGTEQSVQPVRLARPLRIEAGVEEVTIEFGPNEK